MNWRNASSSVAIRVGATKPREGFVGSMKYIGLTVSKSPVSLLNQRGGGSSYFCVNGLSVMIEERRCWRSWEETTMF